MESGQYNYLIHQNLLTRCMQCVLRVLNPHREAVMRTNIVIDDDLLNEAFSVSNARTKKDLIHEALTEFILKYV